MTDIGTIVLRLIGMVIVPSNLLLLGLVAGTLCLCLGRIRLGRILVVAVASLLAAIATLPVGHWLLRPLEDRFPAARPLPDHVDGIVVLGGAVIPILSAARDQPALNEHAERMTAFAALARRHPGARLVFTGGFGGSPLLKNAPTEAAAARRLFADLGLDVDTILFENRSRNTFENAVMTRDALGTVPEGTWLLVTSASHMPRAVGTFRQAGWTVIPYPVDYQTPPHSVPIGRPDFVHGLEKLDLAAHEWLGLAVYRIQGRSNALFPHP